MWLVTVSSSSGIVPVRGDGTGEPAVISELSRSDCQLGPPKWWMRPPVPRSCASGVDLPVNAPVVAPSATTHV
ncbi:hypothetical protein GCM10010436_68470 [Paractinoplanes durhamensis]